MTRTYSTDSIAAARDPLTRTGAGRVMDAAQALAARLTPARGTGVRRAAAFSELPVYSGLVKHRALAKAVNVSDPFYRSHDAHLGATTVMDGKEHINFASYDYLGLNQHPAVGDAAKRAIDQYGTSVSASRIVAGERPLHRELEAALASFYGVEDAIAFVSGHATNVSTISTLMGPEDLILHDELVHNSALVGIQLSGAKAHAFRHNDLAALEALLETHRDAHKNTLIVVEGLYSMDGDFPDLARLVELKKRFGAWLMVDEAHALGVMGTNGRGIHEHYGVASTDVDIWMGTLSKTLGACGGYICGTAALIEILKYKAPGFVYSVGLSPPVTAAALAALQILEAEPERVARLQANGQLFLAEARAAGLETGTSAGLSVVPVIVGDLVKVVKLTERVLARGVNVLPIIYPAVPLKACRLRFFITSEHTPEQIRAAVRITKEELAYVTRPRFVMDQVISRVAVATG